MIKELIGTKKKRTSERGPHAPKARSLIATKLYCLSAYLSTKKGEKPMEKPMDKKSFVVYSSWKSYFDLMDDPDQKTELLYAIFDLADGNEPNIGHDKVMIALDAIKPFLLKDIAAYQDRCRKNKAAAKKRWSSRASKMQADANAFHLDGDNVNDNDNENVNDNANDNGNDTENDLSCQAGASDIPTEAEVIRVAKAKGLDFSEEEAKRFIQFYYVEMEGRIEGEAIRNWKSLLKGWNNHMLIDPRDIWGDLTTWYHGPFTKLPEAIVNRYIADQNRYNTFITRETAELVNNYLKENC